MDIENGNFGYEDFGEEICIPYIFRNNEKYCATKIFTWFLSKRKINFNQQLLDFTYLKGCEMHYEEAYLMNEINQWHNNSMFPFQFTSNDSLVKMSDVCDIFKYVNDCCQKIKHADQYEMMAGMVQIRFPQSNIILPYVEQNAKRYIPVHFIKTKRTLGATVILTDIEVMYMKFLLDVLKFDISIRNNQLPCVLLDEAVAHILDQTDPNASYDLDENYWPTKKTIFKPIKSSTTVNNNNSQFFASTQKNTNSKTHNQLHTKKNESVIIFDINCNTIQIQIENTNRFYIHIFFKQTTSRKRQRKNTKPKANRSHYYEVDYLVDIRTLENGNEQALVRWKGYSSEDDTWEPISNLNEHLMENVNELREKRART